MRNFKVKFKIHDFKNWITISINKLPNILKSKGNHKTMKFTELREYNMRNLFLQNSCRKGDRETSSRSLFVFEKCFIYGIKASGQHFIFNISWQSLTKTYKKIKLHETLVCSTDILNFDFQKGSETGFSNTFCAWFYMKKHF